MGPIEEEEKSIRVGSEERRMSRSLAGCREVVATNCSRFHSEVLTYVIYF